MKIFRKGTKVLLWALAFSLLIPFQADAASYSFYNVSNNTATDAAIGEAQLFLNVSEGSGGQVDFKFSNIGPEACSITDVYFDDNTSQLLSIASIAGSAGVSFSEGASPSNLPSGNTIGFNADFSADSNPPTQPNGVNPPNEFLTLAFNLTGGSNYSSVLSAMKSGDMLVGIHVQGFDSGGSESFVTPIPPTVLLLGSSLIGLVGIRRKFIS